MEYQLLLEVVVAMFLLKLFNNRNEFYINTIYKVTNTTSATSFFYHLMPSWSSGYPMGNWTQVYIWKEKIKCCKK